MNDPKFRFTTGTGSALLYYGDEFVAKFSSPHVKAFTAVLAANEIMREGIDGFTKHVGAPTFDEAKDVLFRTKAQDEDKIQEMFDQIKSVARELAEERKSLKRITEAADNAVECWLEGGSSQIFRNAIKTLNQILTEEKP